MKSAKGESMIGTPRRASGLLAATLLAVGLASPASADDSLAGKSSAELVALLPDDAAPAEWHAEKVDLGGKAASAKGESCDDVLGDAGDRLRGMASLLAKPTNDSFDFGFIVAYAKESGGYDAVREFRSWASRCQDEKTRFSSGFESLSLTDGPDTAENPSATAAFVADDLDGQRAFGFVTFARVRGLAVMVVSTDEDRETARNVLDHAVEAVLARLRAA
ncbi:hypothetical protein HMPREF9336_02016 [Segniliparus rugosus ATCC BAA-974]|uniref:PknH-like extracellular domain-containing protein n=2 Tax=Segniliparus rugosus TaxID=286804 RepID=E5XR94_SEGRC|nr:hypothetical protein HMPREF9336_02016 [Segniliparus rugosus ATCC BAA-974]